MKNPVRKKCRPRSDANVDQDQMPHYVASDLGLHCLPKYPLRVSSLQRDNASPGINWLYIALSHGLQRYDTSAYAAGLCIRVSNVFEMDLMNLWLMFRAPDKVGLQ